MPILGIMASSRPAFELVGSYDSLATVTVGSGGSASITFAGIPSGYKHLQLRFFAQTNRGTYGSDDLKMQVNSDTGSNYSWHQLLGNGASTLAYAGTTQTYIELNNPVATGVASAFGAAVIDFLDYANTSKYKTTRTLCGNDINGTISGFGGRVGLQSGLWMNTAAISSITITPLYGTAFNQYSSFALFGVK